MAGSTLLRHGRIGRPWWRPSAVSCDEVQGELAAILDGAAAAPAPLVDHVEWCLACQAELARYRRLLRMLGQLRTSASEIEVPAGIVGDVLGSLEVAASRHAIRSVLTGRRLAYAGAVTAAGGAAATLVLVTVWRSRDRAGQDGGAPGAHGAREGRVAV